MGHEFDERDEPFDPVARLAVRRSGTPVVAIRDELGVTVRELGPDGWRGLDGSAEGRAWVGPAEGLALSVDRRDEVCVAFTAPDVRVRRIGVLCHR